MGKIKKGPAINTYPRYDYIEDAYAATYNPQTRYDISRKKVRDLLIINGVSAPRLKSFKQVGRIASNLFGPNPDLAESGGGGNSRYTQTSNDTVFDWKTGENLFIGVDGELYDNPEDAGLEHANGGPLNSTSSRLYSDLSLRERALIIRAAVRNGYRTLPEIVDAYNKFAQGGPTAPVRLIQKGTLYAQNAIQSVKNRIYEANNPSDYSVTRHVEDTMHPENRVIASDPVAEAMWANYMNLQLYYSKDTKLNITQLPVSGMLQKAQYSPTIGTPKYNDVYEVNPALLGTENSYYHPVNDDVLYDLVSKNAANSAVTKQSVHNNSLGTYGVSLGQDENGKYISYYDDWDINPFSTNSVSQDDNGFIMNLGRKLLGDKDDVSIIGNPFSVYGRRYYTDEDIKRIQKDRAKHGK